MFSLEIFSKTRRSLWTIYKIQALNMLLVFRVCFLDDFSEMCVFLTLYNLLLLFPLSLWMETLALVSKIPLGLHFLSGFVCSLFTLPPTSQTPVKYSSVFGISHSSRLKQSQQSFPHQTVCLFWRGGSHQLWFCQGWKEGIAAVRQRRRVKWVSHAAQLPVGWPCMIQSALSQEKEKPSKPRQPSPLTNPKYPFWLLLLCWK